MNHIWVHRCWVNDFGTSTGHLQGILHANVTFWILALSAYDWRKPVLLPLSHSLTTQVGSVGYGSTFGWLRNAHQCYFASTILIVSRMTGCLSVGILCPIWIISDSKGWMDKHNHSQMLNSRSIYTCTLSTEWNWERWNNVSSLI